MTASSVVVQSRASALAKTRRLARAALRRGLPAWQRAALEREVARHEAVLYEEKRAATAKRRRDPSSTRTGIRSGIAPSDVWHLFAGGRPLCGTARYRAGADIRGGDVGGALHRIESQGGTPCRRCLSQLKKGAVR